MDDIERARIAAEHRERERKEVTHCEHCGTAGIYTYSGVVGPWSTDDGKRLTELSDTLRWDGTHEFGRDHDLERCFAKVKAERDRLAKRPSLEFVVTRVYPHKADEKCVGVDFAEAYDPSDMPHAFSMEVPLSYALVKGQHVRFAACIEPQEESSP